MLCVQAVPSEPWFEIAGRTLAVHAFRCCRRGESFSRLTVVDSIVGGQRLAHSDRPAACHVGDFGVGPAIWSARP